MSLWQRWVRQPRNVWLRKALFQIHLWTGIGVGLYIVVVSVSGSVLVFYPDLTRVFSRKPIIVASSGTPLSDEGLSKAAVQTHPGYKVNKIWRPKDPNAAVEIWLEGASKEQLPRLFNPFTGEDMGHAVTLGMRTVTWLLDLHDNLLASETGRLVNGIGGLMLGLLSITGVVIWWPGIKNWRRSLSLRRNVSWKRLTWDLHSAMGFWFFAFIFMWAITGFYLVFQQSFAPIVDYIEPFDETFAPRRIDAILAWLPSMHFGRFRGGIHPGLTLGYKILWVILGLVPAIMFITGGLMWWNRVVRKVELESTLARAVPLRWVGGVTMAAGVVVAALRYLRIGSKRVADEHPEPLDSPQSPQSSQKL